MNDDDDCDSGTYYTNAFLASTQQNLDMASSQQHTGGGYLALAPNLPTIPEASLSLLENSSINEVNLSAEQNVLNALNVCKNLDILSSPSKTFEVDNYSEDYNTENYNSGNQNTNSNNNVDLQKYFTSTQVPHHENGPENNNFHDLQQETEELFDSDSYFDEFTETSTKNYFNPGSMTRALPVLENYSEDLTTDTLVNHVVVNDDDTRRQLKSAKRNLDIGSALDDSELNNSEFEPMKSQEFSLPTTSKQLALIKQRKTKVLQALAKSQEFKGLDEQKMENGENSKQRKIENSKKPMHTNSLRPNTAPIKTLSPRPKSPRPKSPRPTSSGPKSSGQAPSVNCSDTNSTKPKFKFLQRGKGKLASTKIPAKRQTHASGQSSKSEDFNSSGKHGLKKPNEIPISTKKKHLKPAISRTKDSVIFKKPDIPSVPPPKPSLTLPSAGRLPPSPPKTPKRRERRNAPKFKVTEPSPVRSMRSDADGSIDTSIMMHKGELFKRRLDEYDELEDFEKLEEFAVEEFQPNSNQITMQSTPARHGWELGKNNEPDLNLTPPDSGRSGDTEIVHSPGKGIFREKSVMVDSDVNESDDDLLSWNLKPLKIDNLLPPDLDLTVDEDKTIENIVFSETPTKSLPTPTNFNAPLADDVSRIVQEKIDQLNFEIEKFQQQSKRVETMKADCNKQSLLLQKSRTNLKNEFEEKESNFENHCEEELLRIRKEKKKLEELSQGIKLQGNRQARQLENQGKVEVQSLKDQMKEMEKRYQGNLGRLREQMRSLEEDKSDLSSQLKIVSEENLMLQEKCKDLETRKKVNSGKSERMSSWEEINDLVSRKPVIMNETKLDQVQSNLNQNQPNLHKNQSKPTQTQSKHPLLQHKLAISNSQTTVDSYHTALNDSSGSNSNVSHTSSNSQVDRISERDPDGTRRIRFLNTGTVKTVETNGIITVKFANGDVKTCYPEGVEGDSKKDVYFYCDTRTTETSFYDKSDKVKIISFDDGQTEHYYRNGKKEIVFNDQSRRTIGKFWNHEILRLLCTF